jgi:zinc-RING finger domain
MISSETIGTIFFILLFYYINIIQMVDISTRSSAQQYKDLACQNCHKPYDLSERKPVLLSCGDIICDPCYDQCLIGPDFRKL